MKPDHEAAKKWAEADRDNYAPDTQIGNLARAYLDAMAQLDKATELLEAATAHLEDCSRDIVLRRPEDVLQSRAGLALEMANRLRAFLDERK